MRDECDFSRLDQLINDLSTQKAEVKVGFWDEGERHPRSGESSPDIAHINNFGGEAADGDSYIPRRPFFDEAIRKGELALQDAVAEAVHDIMSGKVRMKAAMMDVGQEFFNELYRTLRAGRFLGNAPMTIAMKGFDRPLYETGWLLSQIKIKLGEE